MNRREYIKTVGGTLGGTYAFANRKPMEIIKLSTLTLEELRERLQCHMCDQTAHWLLGPCLWCGDQDCAADIYDIIREDTEDKGVL